MENFAPVRVPKAGVLRRLSIPRKLLLISAVYIFIIAGLLTITLLALGFLSDVRAYVGGEGLWSKSQKDAVYHLTAYVALRREADYQSYLAAMQVPLGDRKARQALSAAEPDLAHARAGFLEGRNHPDDVAGMTTLFRRFGRISYLARAIQIWGEADSVLDDLRAVAEKARTEVSAGELTKQSQDELLREIGAVNDRLTGLEDSFSFTLGEGARQFRQWVSLAMLLLTAIALGAGVTLSARISRQVGGGVLTLRAGARRVSGGDLSQRIAVDSADEIGELARAFNSMTASLERHISALEEARATLAEMDRLKTQFFANVSHELRTPLTLILGPAERLLARRDTADDLRRDVAVIERNAHILRKHVNDLLDLSRLDAGHMSLDYRQVDVARLIRRVASHFEVLAEERRILLAVATPASSMGALDPDKLERVLFNMLSNAFKFTPRGGSVHVTFGATESQLEIGVADSGPGVPADLRQVIFERFRQADGAATREHGGTGLGLAIVKEFVELHHGQVWLDESDRGGAAFHVTLPRSAPGGIEVSEAIAEDPDGAAHRVRPIIEELMPGSGVPAPAPLAPPDAPLVLVVEDNPEMNLFVTETLAPFYRTASAADGEEGLAKAEALLPDLVISDVMMPRKSGDQLLADLRSRPEVASTPFMVLTAKADDALRVRMLRNGAQDFLIKPFSAAELVSRADNLIAVKHAREELEQELRSRSESGDRLAAEARGRRRELQSSLEQLHRREIELRLAVQEREVLLREVHHRVKNNLQVIASLLNLQRAQITDAHANAAMQQCQERVRSMALVHEKLYQRGDLSRIDFADYVRTLVSNLLASHSATAGAVRIEVTMPEFPVEIDFAIPCGLIVHELVSNALLHAFPAGRAGTIWVEGRTALEDRFVLAVRDDGAGLPATVDPFHPQSLGMQLVTSLAAQLGGQLSLAREGGTAFSLDLAA